MPSILYNLGQGHRLAGHLDDAPRFYRLYLLKAPTAKNREEVEERLETLGQAVAQRNKSMKTPPDKPLDSTGEAVPGARREGDPPAIESSRAPESSPPGEAVPASARSSPTAAARTA